MDLYDLISRIKVAETDADSVAILEEELIRFIEEAKPDISKSYAYALNSYEKMEVYGYQCGIDKFESNLLKLLTKEK